MSDEKATVTRHFIVNNGTSCTTHITAVLEEYGMSQKIGMSVELAAHLYRALGRMLTDEEKRATG